MSHVRDPRMRDGRPVFLIEPATLAHDGGETEASIPKDTRGIVTPAVKAAANVRLQDQPPPKGPDGKRGRRRRGKGSGKLLDQYGLAELLAEVWRRCESEGPPQELQSGGVDAKIVLRGITVRRDGTKYATEADYQTVLNLTRRKEW